MGTEIDQKFSVVSFSETQLKVNKILYFIHISKNNKKSIIANLVHCAYKKV